MATFLEGITNLRLAYEFQWRFHHLSCYTKICLDSVTQTEGHSSLGGLQNSELATLQEELQRQEEEACPFFGIWMPGGLIWK